MKRAYRMMTLLLLLAVIPYTTESLRAGTKKQASKADDTATKKKTDAKNKKDRKKNNPPLFQNDAGKDGCEIHPDLSEFYAEIAEVVKLDEKGQKKLLAVQEQKGKTLEKYDEKYDKIIVKIENALDRTKKEKQQEKLRAELKKIEVNREKLQQTFDNKALSSLSAEQRVAWNTYELWSVVSPELEFDDDLEMTDEQVEKSKAVCALIAKKMGAKGRIAQNPSVRKMAIVQIGKQVLTQKQRAAYTHQQRRKRLYDEQDKKTVIRGRRR